MTIENLKAGVSKIRNRVIARVCREMGLMEEWGSGYERVIDACRSGGYPEPDWQELGTVFWVTFYPHPEAVENAHVGGTDLEKIYENAMMIEFRKSIIKAQAQSPINVLYDVAV